MKKNFVLEKPSPIHPQLNQNEGSFENWQWWIGPVLAILTGAVSAGLALFAGYRIPVSGTIFLAIVTYAAFKSGRSSSLITTALVIFYFGLEFFTPLGALNRNSDNALRLLFISLIAPATAWMVARLKSRAEHSLYEKLNLEQEHSRELSATLVKQQQAEEEVRRLNSALEGLVQERTAQLERREELSLKQQQQIQAILAYSSATIRLKDLQGRYLLINSRIEQLLGLDSSKLLGKSTSELFPERNHLEWSSSDRQVYLLGQPLEIEERFEQSDGWHTYLSTKFPVRDETGAIYAIGGISTDITARKRLERESQKMVSLVENSNEFIGIADLEGKIEYLNEAGLKLLGLEGFDQIKGKQISEIYYSPAPQTDGVISPEEGLMPGRKRGEFEFRQFSTGEVIPVFSNIFVINDPETGQSLGIAHLATDLREYKQAQEAVLASQGYSNGIIETSMDAVITFNGKGEIVAFNPAAEKLYGCRASEVMGQSTERFIPPRQRAEYLEYFSQPDISSEELRAQRFGNPLYALGAGGIEVPIEATISRVKIGGEIFSTVFVRDITERQNAFNRLEERVNQRTAELSVLLEISQNVAADFTLQSVKELLTGQLNQLMKYRTFVLYRLQKDGSFSAIGGQSVVADSVLQEFTSHLHEFSLYHNQAVRNKIPFIVDDVSTSSTPEFEQYLAEYQVDITKVRSTMYIPLLVKDEVVGLFSISYSEPGYYTPYHAQLAQAIGYQVAVAIENARLYEQAQQFAALEERQRLARELHDSTSQVLYSLQLGLRALGNFLQREQMKETTDTLAYLIGLAKGGLDEMRLLIFELRPESIEREGLLRALEKQIVVLEGRHSLTVNVNFSQNKEPDLPLEYKDAIYRVAREALHNVLKHANTEQVDLQMDWDAKFVRLVIKDYGQGFDIKEEFPGHYGLHSMEERVAKLPGGQLDIESEPGQGTKVILKVPLP